MPAGAPAVGRLTNRTLARPYEPGLGFARCGTQAGFCGTPRYAPPAPATQFRQSAPATSTEGWQKPALAGVDWRHLGGTLPNLTPPTEHPGAGEFQKVVLRDRTHGRRFQGPQDPPTLRNTAVFIGSRVAQLLLR